MKMKSIIICFCFCCLGSWWHMLSAQEQVRALRPLEQCTLVTDLADRIEEIQVIPIKRRFDAGSQEWMRKKLLIGPGGDLFLVYGREVMCFDAAGKYQFSMQYNRGEECPYHQDACISVDQKKLLFAYGDSEVVFFDLNDGREIERLPMTEPLHLFEEIAPAPDGGFYYYSVSAPCSNNFERGHFLVTRFDRNGKKVESSIPQVGFTVNIFLVSQAVGNTYLIRTQGGDNACYRVNAKGELEKAYTFDLGERGIPDDFGKDKEDLMLPDYMRADYYKMPIYLCESGKFFYFTCCGPQAVAYNFLYARGKDSGIYWKADPNLEIHFLSADEDYFYALIEPVPEEVVRETQDPLLRQIFKQFALSLGEKTSARLVKVKFK